MGYVHRRRKPFTPGTLQLEFELHTIVLIIITTSSQQYDDNGKLKQDMILVVYVSNLSNYHGLSADRTYSNVVRSCKCYTEPYSSSSNLI